ncbi:MAG: DNA gyrase subunit A, partial [Crocinitomicaceae bacterium]|nr:DNA gyrase subunit A [Crocinitomicaceae bacterium]
VTEKTGNLISILNVTDEDDLMIINRSGITIRTGVEELRVMGRATQGVKLISLRGNDQIASVCRVPKGDDEEEYDENSTEGDENPAETPSNEDASDASPSNDEDIEE